MPQSKPFDPNEFAAPATFDPNEFSVAEPTSKLPAPEPSWFDTVAGYIPQPVKSAWNWATSPLTTAPAEFARSVSPYIDQPTLADADSYWMPRIKGFAAGALEGAGDVLSGFTSPLNLATMGSFGGASVAARTGIPTAARGLTNVGRALSAPVAAQGAYHIGTAETPTEALMGGAELVGGLAGTIAPVPKPRVQAKGAGALENLPVKRNTPETIRTSSGETTITGAPQSIIDDIYGPVQAAPESLPVRPPQTPDVVTPKQEVMPSMADVDRAWDANEVRPEHLQVLRQEVWSKASDAELLDAIDRINVERLTRKESGAAITPSSLRESRIVEMEAKNRGIDTSQMVPEPWNNPDIRPSPTQLSPAERIFKVGLEKRLAGSRQATAGEFDPSTLEGLKRTEPKPEIDFVDPNTGEVKPASQAKPGDVPLIPEETPPNVTSLAPIKLGLQAQANKTGNIVGGVYPQRGVPITHDPQFGGFQEHVRGNERWYTHPSLEKPQGPFNSADEALDWRLRYQETPEFNQYLANYNKASSTRSLSGIGEVSSAAGREIMSQVESIPSTPVLPRDLAGAKPRFYFGQGRGYNPIFESDLDKALYIIAQTRKSSADARYLKFVMDHTGLDETAARALGQEVKAYIKEQAKNQEPGDIQISRIIKTGDAGPPKPPVKPPTAGGGGGELPPEPPNRPPTTEVTQSLANRLQKVVDDAGKPNPNAPKEISELLDDATKVANESPDAGIIRQILGANKALLTSWDLSAPGRQGKSFIFNKAWWTSLDDMVKAWGSKQAADNIQQSITDHPSGYFKRGVADSGREMPSFAEKVGLDLTSTEEMFRTTFGKAFEKYSLVGKSSRAHTAFLNKLRSDQFVSMMDAAKKAGLNPETNIRLASAYAKFINEATGRGSVNIGKWKLERNIGVLNDVFFAPKNMSGQIRTWNNVLNPIKYFNYDPVLRKQALRSLFAIAGLGLSVGEMARLAGAKVSNDPTSSDFRKIKIDDTRLDLFGGYQQFPVAAMKLLSGQQTSTITGKTTDLTAGRFGQTTRGSVASRFFTNRLSPLGSFIWAWMNNREFDGKPFEVKRALYERVFPIAAKDIYDMAKEDPMLAAILAVPVTMGIAGTQTYTGR